MNHRKDYGKKALEIVDETMDKIQPVVEETGHKVMDFIKETAMNELSNLFTRGKEKIKTKLEEKGK